MKAVKTVKKHFAPPSPQSAIVCRHKLPTAENDFNSLIQLNYDYNNKTIQVSLKKDYFYIFSLTGYIKYGLLSFLNNRNSLN